MSERSPLLRRASVTAFAEHDDHVPVNDTRISKLRGLAITSCIFALIFLSTCNISALTTIQSAIAIDLHATTETSWFMSTLLIASASITPIAGKLCQVFTARVYLLGSVLLQALGLLIAAFAPNIPSFLFARVVYGSGVAALAPVALILIKDHAPERLQGLFFGLVNCAYTTGVACGAIIAGALEPVVGWRAVFWLQCPLVTVLAFAVFWATPRSPTQEGFEGDETSISKKLGRLDYFGIFTLVGAMVFLLYSLSAPSLQLIPIMLSAACLVLFVFVETKWAEDPIIPETVLRSRGAILTGLATIGLMSARWGVLFYMPIYGIAVRQWSQERSGVLLIPTNIGFGSGGVIAGWLHVRRSQSYYFATLLCFTLFILSMFSVVFVSNPHTKVSLIIIAIFINGFLAGALLTYTLAHVLFLTAPEHRTAVIPVNVMFRNLAGAVGSSFAGGIFLRSLRSDLIHGFDEAGLPHREDLITQLLARPMLVQKLQGLEKQVAVTSYSSSLRTLFLSGMGLAVGMLVIQAGTGWKAPKAKDHLKQDPDFEHDA